MQRKQIKKQVIANQLLQAVPESIESTVCGGANSGGGSGKVSMQDFHFFMR